MTISFRTARQSGFTLLELLLTVGVMAVVLSGAYTLFDSWMQRAVNRQAASDTLRLQQAAEAYVYANFDQFTPSGVTANVFVEIPIATIANGTYLPTGYTARNAFKQPMKVFRRKLLVPRLKSDGTQATDLAGTPLNLVSLEVLTISTNPSAVLTIRIPNKRLMDAAQAGGPRMGVWSQIVVGGKVYTGRITSPFGEWYVTNSPVVLPATYTAVPDPLGGYLAAYGIVNAEDSGENDSYLYRIEIPGRPELNQMETDLQMNGYAITDTGSMSVDRMVVTGDAAFRGQAAGTSGSETSQAMTLDQALRIDGAGNTRIDMRTTTATCGFSGTTNRNVTNTATGDGSGCAIRGGELNVIAPARYNLTTGAVVANAGNALLNVGNAVSIDGSVITDHTRIDTTATVRGASTFQNVNGTSMTAKNTVVSPTVNIMSTTANTRALQVANVNLFDATATDRLTVGGAMIAAKVIPTGTQGLATNRLEIGNAAVLNTNLITNQTTVTKSLDITESMASGNYHDSIVNRDVRCTLKTANNKTYCEPIGLTKWSWNGRYFDQECTTFNTGDGGYVCSDWETNSAHTIASRKCVGRCTYYRDNNGSAITATHSANPTCTYGPSAC